MFLENNVLNSQQKGRLEIICGSMFSGKTEELIKRMRQARLEKCKIVIFKPCIDNRYHNNKIVSHDQNKEAAISIANANDMLKYVQEIDVVGIDECQFFDEAILDVIQKMIQKNIRVIVAGLDMDYQSNPFGCMPHLMAISDDVTKVHAVCMNCGDAANFSYRKTKSQDQILVGEKEEYEALCRFCFKKKMHAK